MAAENIGEIGAELRAEYGGWLGGLLEGWIDPEAADTADVLAELARLEDAVATLAADQAELGRLQSWLTAGFHADAPPIALPLAPTPAAAADDARDGGEAARLLGIPSPSAPRTRPTGGFAADPGGWRIPGAPTRSPDRLAAIEDARTSGFDRPVGSGDGDRDLPGSGDRDRGGSAERNRFDVTADGESVDRDRWGDGSAAPSEARHGALDGDPHRPAQMKGAGGIGGLGDLAALAGLGGLDLPFTADDFTADDPRTDDPTAIDPPRRPASPDLPTPPRARTWSAPDAPPATERDPSSTLTTPQPIRLRGWPNAASVGRSGSSAERSGSPAAEWAGGSASPGSMARGSGEGSSEAARRAVEDAERAARSWEALAAMAGGAEVAFPFERMPGEDDQAADLAPAPLPRPASPPVVSRGWDDADAMSGPFMADADERTVAQLAGMPGPRLRPAAEIVGALGAPRAADPIAPGAPRTIIAPPPSLARRDTEWPALADGAEATPADVATHPAEVPTVLVRGTVAPAADEPTEPPSWPEADVTDVLDALSREIMHEYRRYYGE